MMYKRFLHTVLAVLLLAALLLMAFPVGAELSARPQILHVEAHGAVITVETDRPVTAYCVTTNETIPPASHPDWRPCSGTTLSIFKTDGEYYVRVRDEVGWMSHARPVTVSSGYACAIEAEGVRDLQKPIETMLRENGDAIQWFNEMLAETAVNAGLYTRGALGSVCLAFLDRMNRYGYTLNYEPRGNFTGMGDWGVAKRWGTWTGRTEEDAAGIYRRYGMNCGTIIVWAYKQAGLNIVNTAPCRGIYDVGRYQRQGDNRAALNAGDTGDIVATQTGHTLMILDRVDTDADGLSDSYLVFEMESPYLKLKLRSLYSIRNCTLYSMARVFDDSSFLRDHARYWKGSFRIPLEEMPYAYRSAAQTSPTPDAEQPDAAESPAPDA